MSCRINKCIDELQMVSVFTGFYSDKYAFFFALRFNSDIIEGIMGKLCSNYVAGSESNESDYYRGRENRF